MYFFPLLLQCDLSVKDMAVKLKGKMNVKMFTKILDIYILFVATLFRDLYKYGFASFVLK